MTRNLRLFVHAIVCALVLFAAPATSWTSPLSCRAIGKFAERYLEQHISHNVLTPELEARTIDRYLRSFDPSQSVLLQGEIDLLKSDLSNVFARVGDGNCIALDVVRAAFIDHHKKVTAFVEKIVKPDDYAVDPTAELILDAKKRGYPKTAEERDALILNLVHFQMSNYETNDTPIDEAKGRIVHRYELRAKRIAELDSVDLFSTFLDAFATSLDPHSSYFSAETYEDFRISMSLSLIGIGVALSERDGFAVVERVIPGGAADEMDVLKPKDKIIEVAQHDGDPVDIIDMPLRDAVSLIRGKKGTEVRLTILRQEGGEVQRFPVSIVRAEINLEDEAAKLRFDEREFEGQKLKLAILELPSFYGDADPNKRQCTDDVARHLREVKEQNADGLVLDLSRNGGGLLTHAVTVSGFFLRKGEIVKVQNARGQQEVLSDRDEAILYSGPLVVHTSRVSASAAEILAGALKDYKRAVIVGGDHTFGKGTVQTVSSLSPDQGALKITTAMFYRPGGKSTQHDGVEADVVIPSVLSSDDFGEKHQPFSIQGNEIRSFQSSYAIANPQSRRWEVVTPEVVEKLATASKQRIEASSDFEKIQRKILEAQESNGKMRISDMLKRQAEEDADDEVAVTPELETEQPPHSLPLSEEATDDAEDEPSPQLAEATNILVDLIAMNLKPAKPEFANQ